jgi:nucleotide-binding universal stress UspA family protein
MSQQISPVVVAYDFSATAREALNRSLIVAARAPFHVLHIVCVIEPHMPLPAVPSEDGEVTYQYAERVQHAITEVVSQELQLANTTEQIHFFVHARIGKPAAEILAVAKEIGADLIMIGSKGLTGVERFVLGSVAEKVVREAGCTVEVVRPKTYESVPLLEVTTVERSSTYVRPHRYTYESARVQFRPSDWPLY